MIASVPPRAIARAGLAGGLVGGACIWVYEAVVWAGVQHLLPLAAIPANATGLMLGKAVQHSLGPWASVLGTVTHFGFAMVWGLGFAAIWPRFARRGWEATALALPFAVVLWVVMHGAILIAGHEHPDYGDPAVIIGGVMSHLFFAVPLALVVRAVLRPYLVPPDLIRGPVCPACGRVGGAMDPGSGPG